MLGWHGAHWLVAFNPRWISSWPDPERVSPPIFAPSLKVSRTVTDWAALGLEYYAGSWPDHGHQAIRTADAHAVCGDRRRSGALGIQLRHRTRLSKETDA